MAVYETIRQRALERDEYTCQLCFRKDVKIEIHHWLPLRFDGKHELNNIISLCRICHKDIEKEHSEFFPLIVRRRPQRYLDSRTDYVMVYKPNHPKARCKYVFEHILIAEQKIGRPLLLNEVVHHINEIKNDNRPENLQVMTRTEHSILHHTGIKHSQETKARIGLKSIGRCVGKKYSKEAIQKSADKRRGRKHSEESRQKMSIAVRAHFANPENRKNRSRSMKDYFSNPENRKKQSEKKKAYFAKKKLAKTLEAHAITMDDFTVRPGITQNK